MHLHRGFADGEQWAARRAIRSEPETPACCVLRAPLAAVSILTGPDSVNCLPGLRESSLEFKGQLKEQGWVNDKSLTPFDFTQSGRSYWMISHIPKNAFLANDEVL